MLLRVLRTYLSPYRRWLTGVVVLQFVSTVAMLLLPSINADIIDRGVLVNDNGYILREGVLMLGVARLWYQEGRPSEPAVAATGRDARSTQRETP